MASKGRAARTIVLVLLLAGVYVRSADAAISAELVTCNEGINHPVKILNNLVCTGNGLRVTGDNVTLDLGGHTISGDGGSGDIGIDVNARNTVLVRNGTVLHFNNGVHVGSSNDVTIDGVTSAQNTLRGIAVDSGTERTILRHNTVTGNAENGIDVLASGETKVLGNRVIGNTQNGISFNGFSDGGKIDGNTVIGNAQGINVINSSDSITNNNTSASKIDGIVVGTSAVTVIAGNNSHDNAGEGINISSNGNTVKNNIANDNGDDGIFVAFAAISNVLNGNVANKNNSNGIESIPIVAANNNTANKNGFLNGIDDAQGFGLKVGPGSTGTGNVASGNDGATQCSPANFC